MVLLAISGADRPVAWGNDVMRRVVRGPRLHVVARCRHGPVAGVETGLERQAARVADTGAVARQYTYDPYGRVIADEAFGLPAHNRLGHHGLFFDRLDADAPALELTAGARGLYHNRTRGSQPLRAPRYGLSP